MHGHLNVNFQLISLEEGISFRKAVRRQSKHFLINISDKTLNHYSKCNEYQEHFLGLKAAGV